MQLTGKDAVTTLFTGVIVAVFVAYLRGADLLLISSTRGTTAAVLIPGVVGGCALGAAGEAYGEQAQKRATRIFIAAANAVGVIALIAVVAGLVFDSEIALAILVAATLGLWVIATSRHAFTIPPRTAPGPGHRELTRRCGIEDLGRLQ